MAGIILTYDIAHAAAKDAANRSMRGAGRTAWSEEDYNVCCEAQDRLAVVFYYANVADAVGPVRIEDACFALQQTRGTSCVLSTVKSSPRRTNRRRVRNCAAHGRTGSRVCCSGACRESSEATEFEATWTHSPYPTTYCAVDVSIPAPRARVALLEFGQLTRSRFERSVRLAASIAGVTGKRR